jgi:hypothetical protein
MSGSAPADRTLRCHRCREVIGVYEPMVVLLEDRPVHTARIAAEAEQLTVEPCFHSGCFAAHAAEGGARP